MILTNLLMKLLLVDDSILLQKRWIESLKKIDGEIMVYQAFNCKQAMEYFKLYEPDTVVLDIELPDGSGINLLRSFKEEKPAVNVIVLTNHSTGAFRKGCMELGAMDFIGKSDMLRLFKIIRSLS